MYIYVKKFFYFHIFVFFLVFKHDFIICVDYTRIAASNMIVAYFFGPPCIMVGINIFTLTNSELARCRATNMH